MVIIYTLKGRNEGHLTPFKYVELCSVFLTGEASQFKLCAQTEHD